MGISEGLPKGSAYPDEMGRAAYNGSCVDLATLIAHKVSQGGQIVGESSIMGAALVALGKDRRSTSDSKGGAPLREDGRKSGNGASKRINVTASLLGSYRW